MDNTEITYSPEETNSKSKLKTKLKPKNKRKYTRRVPRTYRRPSFLVRTNDYGDVVWTCRLDRYGRMIDDDITETISDFSRRKSATRDALGQNNISEAQIVDIIENKVNDKYGEPLLLKNEEKTIEDQLCFDPFETFDPVLFEML